MAREQPTETTVPDTSGAAETARINRIGNGAEGLGIFLLLGLVLFILFTRSSSVGLFIHLLWLLLGAVGLTFWIAGIGLRRRWQWAAPAIIAAAPALIAVFAGVLVWLLFSIFRTGVGSAEGLSFVPWPIALILAIPGIPLWAVASYAWSLRHRLQGLFQEGPRADDAAAVPKPRISALAVTSFVLSIPALVACWVVYEPFPIPEAAITALLLALVAQVQIRRSRGRVVGIGFVQGTAAVYVIIFMLLYPMYLRDVDGFHKGLCLRNAKELAVAMRSYLDDHNGIYPPAQTWSDALKPYVSADAFLCRHSKSKQCGFAFNAALGGRRAADITADPARLVLFFESDAGWNAHGGPELLPAEPRHIGGDNVSFPDGHAKWLFRARHGDPSPPRWRRAYPPDAVVWDPDTPTEGEPSPN